MLKRNETGRYEDFQSAFFRRLICVLVLLVNVVAISMQSLAFSDNWYKRNGKWRLKDKAGRDITSAWVCDDVEAANGNNVWYLIDANGYMMDAPLVLDDSGNYYSLEQNHNGYYGMLRFQSGNYDGMQLSMNSQHDGSFAALDAASVQQLQGKYSADIVDFGNENIVHTKDFQDKTTNLSQWSYGHDQEIYQYIQNFKSRYIKNGMSDEEIEYTIIKYLCKHVSYKVDSKLYTGLAYGAFKYGKAQCSGYADAFQDLAEACGLECIQVVNWGMNHDWNVIKLHDQWYEVDVTWADQGKNGINVYYVNGCFNRGYDTKNVPEISDDNSDLEDAETWFQEHGCKTMNWASETYDEDDDYDYNW